MRLYFTYPEILQQAILRVRDLGPVRFVRRDGNNERNIETVKIGSYSITVIGQWVARNGINGIGYTEMVTFRLNGEKMASRDILKLFGVLVEK